MNVAEAQFCNMTYSDPANDWRYNSHAAKKEYTLLKTLKPHLENTPDLNGDKNDGEYGQGDVLGMNGCHMFWWKWKLNLQRAAFKDTPKIKVEKISWQARNFIAVTQNGAR